MSDIVKHILAYGSAFCGFSFYILIVISIIRKRTSPSRATWLIWWVNDCLIFFSSYASGARNTSFLPGTYVFMGLLAFLVSIRNDKHAFSKVDITCLIGAVLGWIIWLATAKSLYGLFIGVAVNTIGAVPTCYRALKMKDSQEVSPWLVITFGGLCSVLSSENSNLGVLLFPINSLCVSSTITLLLLYSRRRT